MRKFVLDTNLYIDADRDAGKAEELVQFYSAFLPFTYLHAAVAQELIAGGRTERRRKKIYEAFIAPFERRGRVLVPTYRAWMRAGELLAELVQRQLVDPGSIRPSFLNDLQLAASCRESSTVLVTRNVDDFRLIRRVEHFEFTAPWPESDRKTRIV